MTATRRPGRGPAVLVLFGLALGPAVAAAQPAANASSQSPIEAAGAIDAGREGAELYKQGRWAEAYERFALGDRMTHSPVFVLYMARCARNLGRLVEAATLLRRTADETLAPAATEPMRAAQREARAELAEVEARTPVLVLALEPEGARVTIDDRPVAAGKHPLDPGTHRVSARWSDGARLERTVQLVEGGSEQRLVLSPPPASAGEGARPGPVWPGVAALGTGLALIAVGAVSGTIALMQTSDLRDSCREGLHCRPEQEEDYDRAKTVAAVSTVTFIAGGVLGAVGVGLLVIRPFGSASPSAAAVTGVTLGIGPVSF